MKVVINDCFGGFGLSDMAIEMIMERKGFGCFRYKYDISNNKFVKCGESDKGLFSVVYYCTEDFGDVVKELPDETRFEWCDIDRNDIDLIAVVQKLGRKADSGFSKLAIVKIPDDVEWEICDFDGWESIHEKHRVWTA